MLNEIPLYYDSNIDMYVCDNGKAYTIEQAEFLEQGGICELHDGRDLDNWSDMSTSDYDLY